MLRQTEKNRWNDIWGCVLQSKMIKRYAANWFEGISGWSGCFAEVIDFDEFTTYWINLKCKIINNQNVELSFATAVNSWKRFHALSSECKFPNWTTETRKLQRLRCRLQWLGSNNRENEFKSKRTLVRLRDFLVSSCFCCCSSVM